MTFKDLTLGSPEQFNALIEIPKGSPVKLEYNPETDKIEEDFVFKNGFTFLNNYGLIPQTLSEDGDHLDVFVLADHPISSGSVISAVPVGMIEQLDRGERDYKILAVPADGNSKYKSINDFSAEELREFEDFYAEIARQKNKTIEITGFSDKQAAIEEVRKCADNYAKSKPV